MHVLIKRMYPKGVTLMKGIMRSILALMLILCVLICMRPEAGPIYAEEATSTFQCPALTTTSKVGIDSIFGDYMTVVDCNIYYSMCAVNSSTLVNIFGDNQTQMFQKAKQWINPCMAFATTWGEAGSSYAGVSMTTVMDFNPNTYIDQVDWINLSSNLEQVDSAWYAVNSKQNYNTNGSGKAYRMPNALLQIPKNGNRATSEMVGLGVGPYQITSSDWNRWTLDDRVNPVWGFERSLEKVGTAWINCGIDPISDLTVYAALSLGHQGGGLISMDFGHSLIETINNPVVQGAINRAGYNMFCELREKAMTKEVSLNDIDVAPYVSQVEAETGIQFSSFNGGAGFTNKGSYTLRHCVRYAFYKYYFTSGDPTSVSYSDGYVYENEVEQNMGIAYQSDYMSGTHEHVAYKQSDFMERISSGASLAGAGCGWCSLTSAAAELCPTMCGGITPVDWLNTPMGDVGESYWGSNGMSWAGPEAWISKMNEIGIYGNYSVYAKGEGVPCVDVVKAIMIYAGDADKVVVISASEGLFTSGGHIMCVTDLEGNYFHIADSSTSAGSKLDVAWEDMCNYNFPGIDEDGAYVTGLNGYPYAFKCYWVIKREE